MSETEFDLLKANLRSLNELRDSRGWALVMEAVTNNVTSACYQMADNPTMTEKEVDFRRGAIAAARNFVNVLDLMISRFEAEVQLASVERQEQLLTPRP